MEESIAWEQQLIRGGHGRGATRKAATQAAILRATEDLVRDVRAQGGSAMFITVKQIARRANVAISSVYNHFPAGVGAIALQLADNAKVSNRPP